MNLIQDTIQSDHQDTPLPKSAYEPSPSRASICAGNGNQARASICARQVVYNASSIMTSISTHIESHGAETDVAQLWLAFRDLIGPDLPEPSVAPATLQGGLGALVWNTTCHELRIEEPDPASTQVVWEARTKGSGIRSSGRGKPISCPALALWLGRLCGENRFMRVTT